jgi:crotonobetainyl-CoA:carnitine CoA-transferase CaiB-like acyl-CoA transferase
MRTRMWRRQRRAMRKGGFEIHIPVLKVFARAATNIAAYAIIRSGSDPSTAAVAPRNVHTESSVLPLENLPVPPTGAPLALLSGVTVLDLTTSIAGPYAAMLLGDMGADVIKVERPGKGDDCRAWGPPFLDGESLWFMSVNRNKQSVTLDYTSEAGRAVLHDLVRESDVVIVNLTDRVQKKLGVDHAALAALRSDIVHVTISGFGLKGARKDFPCYDLIAEGYSGVMDLTGEADSPPQKVGTPAADLIAGMDAAYATLAALFDRQRSGKGHKVDIAMIDSMTRFMSPRIVPYLGSGTVPHRTGGRDSVISVYQTFDTKDRPITLGLGNDGIFKRFWQAAGQPGVADDARYATNAQRCAVRSEIVEKIQAVLLTQTREHWLKRFVEHNVPAGPVNSADEVAQDPELIARGLFYTARHGEQRIPQVGLGIAVDDNNASYRSAPPRLGEHNDTVLGGLLGYDSAKIAQLKTQKAI